MRPLLSVRQVIQVLKSAALVSSQSCAVSGAVASGGGGGRCAAVGAEQEHSNELAVLLPVQLPTGAVVANAHVTAVNDNDEWCSTRSLDRPTFSKVTAIAAERCTSPQRKYDVHAHTKAHKRKQLVRIANMVAAG